jgi:hypothetical protein
MLNVLLQILTVGEDMRNVTRKTILATVDQLAIGKDKENQRTLEERSSLIFPF